MNFKKTLLTTTLSLTLCATPVMAAGSWTGSAKDAWLDGKVESALLLNSQLNSFTIDTDVRNRVVTLKGTVASETEKDLAGQLAENTDGVAEVVNQIEVERGHKPDSESRNSFMRRVHDMTITAGLNVRFAAHEALEATRIDVDTHKGVVTLTGEVRDQTARELAVSMARGMEYVDDVEDNLTVTK